MTTRKIGVLGAGNIGGGLGKSWESHGHEVRYAKSDTPQDEVASIVREAEVVALAVPWKAVNDVLGPIASLLAGKILIDCTNPVGWDDGPVVAVEGSAAQRIAELCPGARVVKAFNTLGAEHLATARVHGEIADTFIAGDDAEAKEIVAELAREVGFAVVDLGPLRNAKLAEHLAIAWIHLATKGGLGRDIAFKLLR